MSISFLGASTFAQSGPARWILDGWEFDTLIVPMHGRVGALDTYLASLVRWSPSDIDGNMYLANWDNDDNKQFPTVTLKYIGRKGGVLPPVKTERASGLGQIDPITVQVSFGVEVTVGATYTVPTETVSWISSSQVTRPTLSAIWPGTLAPQFGISLIKTSWSSGQYGDEFILNQVHIQQAIADFNSEEVVPGHYWRNSQTTAWTIP